jgi:trans-aconitate methyltransferase
MSTEGATVELYDDLWLNQWRDMELHNPTARHLQHMISRIVRDAMPIETLLDVGCGCGANIKPLQNEFPSLKFAATDLSDRITDLARQYIGPSPDVEYHALDVSKERLDKSFDLVLCNQVLEHIEDDRAAIANLAAMSKRWVLITVPAGAYNSTSRIVGHVRHYSRGELVEKVEAAGLKVRKVSNWGFPFHSIYKKLLGSLPEEAQRKAGFGTYGLSKRLLATALYIMFYGNIFDYGANVILLAEKQQTS